MATGLYAGTTLPDSGRPVLLLDVQGLLAAAGVDASEAGRNREEAAETEASARGATQLLLFRDASERVRGVRLSVIERVEEVPVLALFESAGAIRSEEHTSELQSLMRISYAVFCLKKKTHQRTDINMSTQN